MGISAAWKRAGVVAVTVALALTVAGTWWLEARPDLATAWSTVELRSGLAVQVPRGWRVETDRLGERLSASGRHDEVLEVWLLPASVKDAATARVSLPWLAHQQWPAALWSARHTGADRSFRYEGRTNTARGTLVVTEVATPGGRVWLAAFTRAPIARAGANALRLEYTLATLRAVGEADTNVAMADQRP